MRPLRFPDPHPARAGGARLWRRPADASQDSMARAAAILGRPVRRDAQGRPRIEGGDVSIAHAGRWWLLAAAPRCVGVDIEPLRERPNALELARAHFPAGEAEWLAALAPARRSLAFLRLWCAREAVLKALGTGLAGGFDTASFTLDAHRIRAPGWRLHEFVPAPGHLGVLALICPRSCTPAASSPPPCS